MCVFTYSFVCFFGRGVEGGGGGGGAFMIFVFAVLPFGFSSSRGGVVFCFELGVFVRFCLEICKYLLSF